MTSVNIKEELAFLAANTTIDVADKNRTPTPMTLKDYEQRHLADSIAPKGSKFSGRVAYELMFARAKHAKPMNSAHEGYAVLLEEVEEVKDEVFHGKDKQHLLEELIQVAAMAQRMAEDLKLI